MEKFITVEAILLAISLVYKGLAIKHYEDTKTHNKYNSIYTISSLLGMFALTIYIFSEILN